MIGSTRVLAFGGGKPILEEYTTARVRSRAKIASWNDFASRRILPLEIVARDTRTFEASLRIGHLGSIAFFETSSLPAMVDHRMEHIASIRERWFGLAMVLQGTVGHSHYGRQITLVPGDRATAAQSMCEPGLSGFSWPVMTSKLELASRWVSGIPA